MTHATPWQSLIEEWRADTGLPLTLACYDAPPPPRRQTGDWWRQGETWCMHLDEGTYVRLSAVVGDEGVRRLLTWAVRRLGLAAPAWTETVAAWIAELRGLPAPALLEAYHQQRPLPTSRQPLPPFPGYLVWLHFNSPTGDDLSRSSLEIDVTEVVQGFLPSGPIAWLDEPQGPRSALLYWPAGLIESEEYDVEPDSDSAGSEEALRHTVGQLLQVLAADGMVSAAASLGCRVDDPAGLYRGAVTVVLAWRQQLRQDGPDNISGWDDQPVAWLVEALSTGAARWFLDVVGSRASLPAEPWSPETVETLLGLLAADLNVSEAARALYLHRNTLLHRIERIRQATGYDIRRFRDAVELWLAWLLTRRTRTPGLGDLPTSDADR